jgi:GT2 family glycosyltransferase
MSDVFLNSTLLLRHLQVIARLTASVTCLDHGIHPWEIIQNSSDDLDVVPSITVIITLFNYEKHITECLDSVIQSQVSQLPSPIEIIVIDDCSTDRSVEVVTQYLMGCSYPIRLVKKAINTGLADARNLGLKLAHAPYVFILDADNKIEADCLIEHYQMLQSSDYISVYATIHKFDHDTGASAGSASYLPWQVDALVQDPYIDAMAMFDREKMLQLGGYSTNLIHYGWFGWEDYELWLRIASSGQSCGFIPKVLSHYRVHSASMIHSTNAYSLNLSRYFVVKFPELASRIPSAARLFGSWRQAVEAAPPYTVHELFQSQDKIVLPQPLESLSAELRATQEALAQLRSSRLWRVRQVLLKSWTRVRKTIKP